jgi:transposase-like protein
LLHEAGRKVAELAREHGVSEATLYGWKSKYGGMGSGFTGCTGRNN